ncbi:MAG: hypothetical protein KDB37_06135 [Ilumatobacter sp.]|nr:hypothetical protein [Ilumatobacter sp.]
MPGGRWTLLTPHANVLLALDADPDTKLVDLADDTQVSYRWMVKITSELLDAGYLDRTRHGRTYRYEVTCPGESDLIDPRAARVHQLSHVLASSTRVVPPEEPVAEDRSVVLADSATTTLAAELEHLRYEVVLETQRLCQIQAESRHLEAAIERARSALREPVT